MTGICLPLLRRPGVQGGLSEVVPCKEWSPSERMFWWPLHEWRETDSYGDPAQFNKLFPWIDGEFVVLPSLPVCLAERGFIRMQFGAVKIWWGNCPMATNLHGFITSTRKPWSSLSTILLPRQVEPEVGIRVCTGWAFHWVHSAERPRAGLWLRQMWSSYSSFIMCYPHQWGTTSSWPTQFLYIKTWCSDAQPQVVMETE